MRNIIASRTSQNLTIKLNPAALGEIELSIEVVKDIVNARIEVENDAVRQVVNSGVDQLKQSLVQQGFQTSSINISLATPEDKNQKFTRNTNKKKHSAGKEVDNGSEINEDTIKNMGYNTYDYVA